MGSMLTPAGTGKVEPGRPIDQVTGVAAVRGAMLKFPIAVNCTLLVRDSLAVADEGETEIPTSNRPWSDTKNALQEVVRSSAAEAMWQRMRAETLRINTSESCREGKHQRIGETNPPGTMLRLVGVGKRFFTGQLARVSAQSASVRVAESDGLIRLGHAQQNLEEQEPALQVHGDQEVFLGMLTAVLADLRRELRMREQITDLVGAAFH